MDFDSYLKLKASEEPVVTPSGYGEKINNVLESLGSARPRRLRPKHRLPLVAAIFLIVILACGTVLAVNIVLKMQGSEIGFFADAQGQDFTSQQAYWEDTSDKVDTLVPDVQAVQTVQPTQKPSHQLGVAIPNEQAESTEEATFTVDNIAMDVNYLNIFYTVKTTRPIKELTLEMWRAQAEEAGEDFSEEDFEEMYDNSIKYDDVSWLVDCWFVPKINGEEVELMWGNRGGQSYLANEYTYVGTGNYGFIDNIPEQLTLNIELDSLMGQAGKWRADFDIDLAGVNAKSKIAYPDQTIQVKDAFYDYIHNITVERVSVTDNGGMIVLGETGGEFTEAHKQQLRDYYAEEGVEAADIETMVSDENLFHYQYVDFLIYDQDGNPLSRVLGDGGTSGGKSYVKNVLEFAADTSIESVTLVPYTEDWKQMKEVEVMFDEIGVEYEIFPGSSVTLLDVSYDQETEYSGEINTSNTVTIKYIEKGLPVSHASKRRFLGADGAEFELQSTMSSENPYVDPSTGTVTDWIAVEFRDDRPGNIRSFTGMIFEYQYFDVDDSDSTAIPLQWG